MPADFITNQGDTGEAFAQQITDAKGPVDLTDATVELLLWSTTATTPMTLTGTQGSPDPMNGIVQWQPSLADVTSSFGDFQGKWQITFTNGAVQKYPTDGWIWVRIEPSIGSEAPALVGLSEVKDYLQTFGVDRTHDYDLLHLIQSATPIIENVAGPIIVRTFEEWHDGGQTWIQLRRRPSSALGTTPVLTILGCDEYRGPIKYPLSVVADPTQATIYSVMLDAKIGTLYRRSTGGGLIPFGAGYTGSTPQAVHVIYQAGQQSVPENVRGATLEAIRQHYQTTMATGAGSRTLVDTYEGNAGPGFAQLVDRVARQYLAPMRRHPTTA